jgi:hypothetical protein
VTNAIKATAARCVSGDVVVNVRSVDARAAKMLVSIAVIRAFYAARKRQAFEMLLLSPVREADA